MARGDPYGMTARYAGKCAGDKCGHVPFAAGTPAFYYPNSRDLFVGPCADAARRDFNAHAADDAFESGGY